MFESVFPSKLLESFATAKPVILGVRGFAAALLQKAGAGICIEPENERELVAALERLADDRTLSAKYGKSGLEYVTKHFNLDGLAAEYVRVLETTLKT